MNFAGLTPIAKDKITKLLQAIYHHDLAALYTSLRETDETLREALLLFLSQNKLPGYNKALNYLFYVKDSAAACRGAAVCLALTNLQGAR